MTPDIGYCFDDEDCPRDSCDGVLEQQDRFNVMCLSCEGVWVHYRDETTHYLTEANGENVAERPHPTAGLYDKYHVEKDGEPVHGCFVLEPETDHAARMAVLAYANATEDDELCDDLVGWIASIRDDTDCRWRWKNAVLNRLNRTVRILDDNGHDDLARAVAELYQRAGQEVLDDAE